MEGYSVPDYKAMYYHLAGRMAATVEVLDALAKIMTETTKALNELKDRLALAQQKTEEMFIDSEGDDEDLP